MYRHALPHTPGNPCKDQGVQIPAEVRYAVKMAEVIGAPVEVLTLSVSPVSPLTIPDSLAEAIIEIAEAGIALARCRAQRPGPLLHFLSRAQLPNKMRKYWLHWYWRNLCIRDCQSFIAVDWR